MLVAEQLYSGKGVMPLYDGALLDNVALPAGVKYLAGQLLAAVAGSGSPVNAVETLTVTGSPTGGTLDVYWAGIYAFTLAWNSTAAQAKTAAEAFFGVGNITTSGGPLPASTIVFTFQGESGGMPQPLMTVVHALTGGTTPNGSFAMTTAGNHAGGHFTKYIDGTADPARRVLRYPASTDWRGIITPGDQPLYGVPFVNPVRGAPAYFSGYFRCSDLVGLDANAVTDLGKLINGTAFNSPNAILNIT